MHAHLYQQLIAHAPECASNTLGICVTAHASTSPVWCVTHVRIEQRLAQEYTSFLPSTAAVLLWLTAGHKCMRCIWFLLPGKEVASWEHTLDVPSSRETA